MEPGELKRIRLAEREGPRDRAGDAILPPSVNPQLFQFIVVESKVMSDLMLQCLANAAPNLSFRSTLFEDRSPKEKDLIGHLKGHGIGSIHKRHPAVIAQQLRGILTLRFGQDLGIGPILDHDGDVGQMLPKLRRQTLDGPGDKTLKFSRMHGASVPGMADRFCYPPSL